MVNDADHQYKVNTREYPAHPRVGVGAVVFKNGCVLLVRRGQPPAKGQWAIPGGTLALGESLQAGAEREVMEETGITIRAGEAVFTFDAIIRDDHDRIQYHYVIVDMAGEYMGGEPQAADDADAAQWVSETAIRDLPVNAETRRLLRERFGFGG